MYHFDELGTTNIAFLLAAFFGLVAGFFLGWQHHQLKKKHLSPVVNYTIGSVACLVAQTLVFLILKVDLGLIGAGWVIWVIAGAIVAFTHKTDKQDSHSRIVRSLEDEPGDSIDPGDSRDS